jgi:hypothetical protein
VHDHRLYHHHHHHHHHHYHHYRHTPLHPELRVFDEQRWMHPHMLALLASNRSKGSGGFGKSTLLMHWCYTAVTLIHCTYTVITMLLQ